MPGTEGQSQGTGKRNSVTNADSDESANIRPPPGQSQPPQRLVHSAPDFPATEVKQDTRVALLGVLGILGALGGSCGSCAWCLPGGARLPTSVPVHQPCTPCDPCNRLPWLLSGRLRLVSLLSSISGVQASFPQPAPTTHTHTHPHNTPTQPPTHPPLQLAGYRPSLP